MTMCVAKILDALKPRPTIVAWICEDTGLLAGAKCTKIIPRRYYVEPRPGEPEIPADVCDVHDEPAPQPEHGRDDRNRVRHPHRRNLRRFRRGPGNDAPVPQRLGVSIYVRGIVQDIKIRNCSQTITIEQEG
jgi:hypothetical protein